MTSEPSSPESNESEDSDKSWTAPLLLFGDGPVEWESRMFSLPLASESVLSDKAVTDEARLEMVAES